MDSEKDEEDKTKRKNTAIYRRNSIKSETTSVASCRTQSTLLGSMSSNSTPKKSQKIENPDFCVTGKQFLRKPERASSTGALGRRKSIDSILMGSVPKNFGNAKKGSSLSQSYLLKGRCTEMSVGEDMTLDISEISGDDKNDTLTSLRNKRQHFKKKMLSVATSTPRNLPQVFRKPRSASVQAVRNPVRKREPRKCEKSFDSCDSSRSVFTCSGDSVIKTSSTDCYRNARSTDLDNSSASPEGSQSSCDMSRTSQPSDVAVVSPFSQRSQLSASSSFYSSWMEPNTNRSSQMEPKEHEDGEWSEFWANYNSSVNKVPLQNYYDLCPTPYRSESIGIADLDFLSEETLQQKSPKNVEIINEIIRNDGIHLTSRETQNLIKCTHILENVLTKALDRNVKEKRNATEEKKVLELLRGKNSKTSEKPKPNPDFLAKKANLTLDLKEQLKPFQVKPNTVFGTLGTQTDISLPNTKSAPKIFEKILRQLSRTSIDEQINRKTEEPVEIPVNICEGNENAPEASVSECANVKVIDGSDKSVAPSVEKTE